MSFVYNRDSGHQIFIHQLLVPYFSLFVQSIRPESKIHFHKLIRPVMFFHLILSPLNENQHQDNRKTI